MSTSSAPRPRSLRTRLVVGVLGLVLVMAATMGAFSTITLHHTLMNRLDDQLTAASHRAEARRHGEEHDGSTLDQQAPDSAVPSASPAEPSATSSPAPSAPATHTCGDQDPAAVPGAKPVPAGLDAAGQATGTLTLIASGASDTGSADDSGDGDGADGGDADHSSGTAPASATVTAGYIDDDGRYQSLAPAECQVLLSLETTGEPVTVGIDSLGDYRVLASKDATTGDIVITGLSMKADNTLVRTQLLVEGAIVVIGTLIAALAGRTMVRSSLTPLERVASTAERVASQPLARGEVSIDERVPGEDLTSSREVGQVGSALNTLLGHVDDALTARQHSETQVRQFVADASHELRTPLASIRGYTELIAREGADAALPDEAVHALERVHSESLRMSRLVEDLLLLARLDAGRDLNRDEVDLVGILLDTVSDARAAGPDHEWELDLAALDAPADLGEDERDDFEPEPPLVLGDEARLRQVLVNLLANARVHTPAGSHVITTLSRRTAPVASDAPNGSGERERGGRDVSSGGAAAAAAPPGEELVITISDDGPGIEAAVRGRLFERFARGDASRERRTGSTGLGMSIALAIVVSHGGTLTVDSICAGEDPVHPQAHGTIFTVALPAAPAAD
ncbi:sensor histidine kinase [Actinomyces sp. oral taxon 448]|uniref:sensor histidine kinase n=1 Tax=Actinomyces sp. oral taxon 448 TaxID=712124 RepID=UPI0002188C27|nr:periplasmic sensor histidine kinase [Actinomyces sp. oral taxon 448 str. F0400]